MASTANQGNKDAERAWKQDGRPARAQVEDMSEEDLARRDQAPGKTDAGARRNLEFETAARCATTTGKDRLAPMGRR